MKQRDYKMLDIARGLAATSTHSKSHIGAVLLAGREIISVGVNGRKSHPLQKYYNKFRFLDDTAHHLMHAELDAIVRSSNKSLYTPSTMYIYRLMRDNTTGMSRPCAGCIRALRDFKIFRIFYTTSDGYAYEELK